jgi:DnaJ-class molecular chaperone
MSDCKRCKGTGKLEKYGHRDEGRCYGCNGTGQAFPSWRDGWLAEIAIVSPEEEIQRERAAEKRIASPEYQQFKRESDREWLHVMSGGHLVNGRIPGE